MNIAFTPQQTGESCLLTNARRKIPCEVNILTNGICQDGNPEMGKPEPLTGGLFGYWSQRANGEDRLICRVDIDNTYALLCRFHYVDRQLHSLCEGYGN